MREITISFKAFANDFNKGILKVKAMFVKEAENLHRVPFPKKIGETMNQLNPTPVHNRCTLYYIISGGEKGVH
ncbi:MAG TPA: hypothetical protein VF043_24440 [Ktedonobacteraceae bacterium]